MKYLDMSHVEPGTKAFALLSETDATIAVYIPSLGRGQAFFGPPSVGVSEEDRLLGASALMACSMFDAQRCRGSSATATKEWHEEVRLVQERYPEACRALYELAESVRRADSLRASGLPRLI